MNTDLDPQKAEKSRPEQPARVLPRATVAQHRTAHVLLRMIEDRICQHGEWKAEIVPDLVEMDDTTFRLLWDLTKHKRGVAKDMLSLLRSALKVKDKEKREAELLFARDTRDTRDAKGDTSNA
jgi:hypothetical protein